MKQSRPTRPSHRKRPRQPETLYESVLEKPNHQTAFTGMDKVLLYTTVALSLLGLVAVYSASAFEALDKYNNSLYFVQRQLISFVLGFLVMNVMARIPFFYWNRLAKPIAFGVIGLLVYTMFTGVAAYGAERWIRIAGFQFQPSELGKISVVLLLAQAFGQKIASPRKGAFLVNLIIIGLTLVLIYEQPSLSMTIILAMVSAAMMFIAGISPVFLGGIGLTAGTVVVYKLLHTEYQLRRIQGWLDPWKDAQDKGYNLIQSLFAIGSGGLFGQGLGMSKQKLYYLPFQYTDFIFSVWAEEWGFLGCVVLLGLFLTVLYRGLVIAKESQSGFGQLLAMGITILLAIQLIINVFVATGLFPVTGVTLPLISYGGTSVIVTLAMIGILLNISRYRLPVRLVERPESE